MLKQLVVWSLIGGSAVFTGLILIDSAPKTELPLTEINNPRVEDLPDQLSREILANQTILSLEKLSEEIANLNPEGIQTIEGKNWIEVLDPQKAAEKYLEESVKNFKVEDLRPVVDLKKIKLIDDLGDAAAKKYFENFFAVINKNFGSLGVNRNSPTKEDFSVFSDANEKTIAELYSIAVPRNLFSIHHDAIQLLGMQKNIFTYLRNYQTDPMGAYLAAQAYELFYKEFQNLQRVVDGISRRYRP